MGKRTFAICDSNEVYAKKLYEYFFVKESESYEMVLFTKRQELDDYVKKKKVSILLIGDDLINGDENIENVDHTIVLKSDENKSYKDIMEIYKYRSGDCILKEVMYYCAQNGGIHSRRNNKPFKIIGIYSPVKRCFQTSFSITLGQILAQKSKTIYLNFECFSGFDIMRKMDSNQDMADLMYFLGCGSENFTYRLQSMINQIGDLHYISPIRSCAGRMSIRGEEWLNLLKSFEEYTDYEYLILDLSENMMGLFDILKECHVVYTIVAKDHVSEAKLLQYEKFLEDEDYIEIANKTKKISIPAFKEIPLEYEMLPFSELAKFVRNLLKEEAIYHG